MIIMKVEVVEYNREWPINIYQQQKLNVNFFGDIY